MSGIWSARQREDEWVSYPSVARTACDTDCNVASPMTETVGDRCNAELDEVQSLAWPKPSGLPAESVPLRDRHPNSARFHEILRELGALHDKKQKDYGRDDDPFANVRASSEWGVRPWIGALIRLHDKVRRLQKLASGGLAANESVDDSLRDIAVYAAIALVLFEEERK